MDVLIFSSKIDRLINDGKANFTKGKRNEVPYFPLYPQIADLNGDGILDLAMCTGPDSSISVLVNDGLGEFNTIYITPRLLWSLSCVIGDFDNNGTIDVAVINFDAATMKDTRLTIFSNDGTGKLTQKYQIKYENRLLAGIDAGDLDNDGDEDLVLFDSWTNTSDVMLNDGNGIFTLKIHLPIKLEPNGVYIQDFNGDGNLDIAISDQWTNPGSIALWMNNGNAEFTLNRVPTSYGTSHIRSADFDFDGDLDIVTAAGCYCGPYIEILSNVSPVYAEIENKNILPYRNELYQNYPNPFNPVTTIKYDVVTESKVKLIVYDMIGREVETLVNNVQSASSYSAKWYASDVASGLYFCRLEAQSVEDPFKIYVSTKKMQLIK